MRRLVTLATIAVLGTAGVTLAQAPGRQAPSTAPQAGASDRSAELAALTDARIEIVKAALQLRPDQEQYWPNVENAMRTMAKDRQARITNAVGRLNELRDRSAIEILRDRNPVEFMHRRADALAQRATDLNRLADAWQPLYQTFNPDQKRRMAALAIFVLRDMRNTVEQLRVLEAEDEDEG